MKSTVWISYDLGIRGNYSGLYMWLDSLGAKECGDSLAYFVFEHQGDVRAEIKARLNDLLKNEKGARIYLIYRDKNTNNNKGTFLFGGRKAAPWVGLSNRDLDAVDEGD